MQQIIIAIVCAFIFCGCEIKNDGGFLLSDYIGVNLRNLDKDIKTEFNFLLKSKIVNYNSEILPWHLWKIYNKEEALLILIGVEQPEAIPGSAKVGVYLFNKNHDCISSNVFSTGNRLYIQRIRLTTEKEINGTLIEFQTLFQYNGERVCKQIYGIVNNRIALVRIEDQKGRLIRLNYDWDMPIGPPLPKRSAKD